MLLNTFIMFSSLFCANEAIISLRDILFVQSIFLSFAACMWISVCQVFLYKFIYNRDKVVQYMFRTKIISVLVVTEILILGIDFS